MKNRILSQGMMAILMAIVVLSGGRGDLSAQETSTPVQSEKTVEAEGVATIFQNDRAAARDKAISDAQRKAVEQEVGVLISTESLVENYELVSDRILTQSSGYIRSYEVVDEQQTDTEYRVRIKAVVGVGNLATDLEAMELLLRRKGNPRMMFLVEETIQGVKSAGIGSGDISQAETVLMQTFLDAGFQVVDSATVAANINRDQALKAVAGDAVAAAALGNQYGAEVIITAKVAASSGDKILNTAMKSHQAVITAKVVRADTGAVMTSASEQGKHAHIDDLAGGTAAIQEAAEKLADTLIPRILEQWRQDIQVAATVQLMVSNVSFMQLKTFKTALQEQVRGVKEVYQRSFQANMARLDVEIEGTTEMLADELAMKQFEGFSLEITGLTENRIDLTIQ